MAENWQIAKAKADHVRKVRYEIKCKLKSRQWTLIDVLDMPELDTLLTSELLLMLPQYGWAKVRRTLADCHISEFSKIQQLTPRQKDRLRQL